TYAEEEPRDEESFDPIPRTSENSNDEGNNEENLGINVGKEEGHNEEEEEHELYIDVNINQGRGIQTTQEFEDSHVTLTPINPDGQHQSSSMSSQFMTTDNDEFLKTIDENMQKIIKEQVKEQVKTKNPSLDQTGGPRDVEKEMSQSQQALHMRQLAGALAGQQSKS
nr:hypothetical protein [Tanacetum cinerariifolium]